MRSLNTEHCNTGLVSLPVADVGGDGSFHTEWVSFTALPAPLKDGRQDWRQDRRVGHSCPDQIWETRPETRPARQS